MSDNDLIFLDTLEGIIRVAGNRDDVLNESADLVYHLLVLLNSHGATLADVVRTLESRHR